MSDEKIVIEGAVRARYAYTVEDWTRIVEHLRVQTEEDVAFTATGSDGYGNAIVEKIDYHQEAYPANLLRTMTPRNEVDAMVLSITNQGELFPLYLYMREGHTADSNAGEYSIWREEKAKSVIASLRLMGWDVVKLA